MPNRLVQEDIKIGATVKLKEQEQIDRELEELVAAKDARGLILRLAQLNRMEDARAQLDNLERFYDEQLKKLQAQLDELQKPPLRDAVFLKPSPDEPQHCAIVGIGGTRMEVVIAAEPSVPLAALPGCEVWINGENQIVKFRDAYIRGDAAEVVEVLDETRLRVKAQGHEEIIVERLATLNDQPLEAGDTVRVHTGLGVAFERLSEKEKKALEPERIPDVRYDQVGGVDEQIDKIREAIEYPFLYRRHYKEYGLGRPKGILLHGPPGCGKTMIAKAIANNLSQEIRRRLAWNVEALELYLADGDEAKRVELYAEWREKLNPAEQTELPAPPGLSWGECGKALGDYVERQKISLEKPAAALERLRKAAADEGRGYFLSINGPELLNKYVGETEYSIRRIFTLARKKASYDTPVVIFFDELESLFSRRGSGISSDIESTVVPQLLSEIDGIDELNDVIIIGASNRYDLIDPAVLRPGRLDLKIFVGRPDRKSAASVLAKYLTPSLPFAPSTLEEFGGSVEQAAHGLIERAVETIYSPKSYLYIYEKADPHELMNREHRKPLQKRKQVSEIVSGAMLESIVTRAKRSAVRREIEEPERERGLCWRWDVLEAIRVECEESKEQYVSEVRSSRDISAAESFGVDVHLDEAPGGAASITAAKWFGGKARSWAEER